MQRMRDPKPRSPWKGKGGQDGAVPQRDLTPLLLLEKESKTKGGQSAVGEATEKQVMAGGPDTGAGLEIGREDNK